MINLLGSLVGPVTGLLDKVIEDKDQKNKLWLTRLRPWQRNNRMM